MHLIPSFAIKHNDVSNKQTKITCKSSNDEPNKHGKYIIELCIMYYFNGTLSFSQYIIQNYDMLSVLFDMISVYFILEYILAWTNITNNIP